MSKKKIAQVKFTNCCWVPDEMTKCINKYSDNYEATLIYLNDSEGTLKGIPTIKTPVESEMYDVLMKSNFEFIHFHNKFINVDIPSIIQYHSPPWYGSDFINKSYSGRKFVVGQYHATLSEYSDCVPVPNIIDIYDETYTIRNNENSKIRIGFSPSVLTERDCVESKGYKETKEILERIRDKNSNVEIDIIHGLWRDDCIRRKSESDILIDECKTNSYHRCALEAMSLGKLTICSMDDAVVNIVKKMMNVESIPMHNLWMKDLENGLQNIINRGVDYIKEEGKKTREWMEKNWNPKDIVRNFEKIYNGGKTYEN